MRSWGICAIRAVLPIRLHRTCGVWQRISLALMGHSFLLVPYRRVKVPGFRIRGSQRTKIIRFIWSTVGYCFLCIDNRLLSVAKSAVGTGCFEPRTAVKGHCSQIKSQRGCKQMIVFLQSAGVISDLNTYISSYDSGPQIIPLQAKGCIEIAERQLVLVLAIVELGAIKAGVRAMGRLRN